MTTKAAYNSKATSRNQPTVLGGSAPFPASCRTNVGRSSYGANGPAVRHRRAWKRIIWCWKSGFKAQGFTEEASYDLIYVNGVCQLETLKAPSDAWEICLIEDAFRRLMFESEEV